MLYDVTQIVDTFLEEHSFHHFQWHVSCRKQSQYSPAVTHMLYHGHGEEDDIVDVHEPELQSGHWKCPPCVGKCSVYSSSWMGFVEPGKVHGVKWTSVCPRPCLQSRCASTQSWRIASRICARRLKIPETRPFASSAVRPQSFGRQLSVVNKNRTDSSSFGSNTISDAHYDYARSITLMPSIFPISVFWKSRALGPVQERVKSTGHRSCDVCLMWLLVISI